jgi:hypothetical protein
LLVVAGFLSPASTDAVSLGININLYWGLVMIVFGLLCLWLARAYARKRRGAETATKT